MEMDDRVLRRYEFDDEAGRLWRPGVGELIRLRTWDIFERFLPGTGRIADIGGGPGTHAAHLVDRGHVVTLVDPVPHHVEQAMARAAGRFTAMVGDARGLDLPDESFDAVVLLGPLYHLPEEDQRLLALAEARRILRSGGRLIAEVITRHAWILDATAKGLIADEQVRRTFRINVNTGLSADPDSLRDGAFWAYFYRVDQVTPEVERAGFVDTRLVGVEGHAWLLSNLEELLSEPQPLLDTLRLVESEPSLLGVSGHLMAIATKP